MRTETEAGEAKEEQRTERGGQRSRSGVGGGTQLARAGEGEEGAGAPLACRAASGVGAGHAAPDRPRRPPVRHAGHATLSFPLRYFLSADRFRCPPVASASSPFPSVRSLLPPLPPFSHVGVPCRCFPSFGARSGSGGGQGGFDRARANPPSSRERSARREGKRREWGKKRRAETQREGQGRRGQPPGRRGERKRALRVARERGEGGGEDGVAGRPRGWKKGGKTRTRDDDAESYADGKGAERGGKETKEETVRSEKDAKAFGKDPAAVGRSEGSARAGRGGASKRGRDETESRVGKEATWIAVGREERLCTSPAESARRRPEKGARGRDLDAPCVHLETLRGSENERSGRVGGKRRKRKDDARGGLKEGWEERNERGRSERSSRTGRGRLSDLAAARLNEVGDLGPARPER